MRSVSRYLSRAVLGTLLVISPWALQAQDAGDTCDDAGEIVTNGSYNFDTTGASGNDPCFAGPPTVFYQWTAPSDGTATVDLCGSSYDTWLTVLTFTTCPADCDADFVGDDDDFCGLASSVTFNAAAGTKYLFVVSGVDSLDFGPGVLNFSFTPLVTEPGDTCSNPFEITGNGAYPFDTTDAISNEPCGFNVASPTVWFRYEAVAVGTIYATLCAGGVSEFESTIVAHITNGTCPTNCSTAVAGEDQCGFIPGEFGVEFDVVPGDIVYLTVSGWSALDFGAGNLTFEFTPEEPLLIELASFSASSSGVGQPATILWSTSSEIDNVGFNVDRVRFQDGTPTPAGRVNPALIPAAGSSSQGASYSLIDPLPVSAGEQRGYVLVDIDANGTATRHGPVRLELGGLPSGEPEWSLY